MKIDQETRTDGKIQLAVTVPVEDVNKALDNAVRILAFQNGVDPNASEDLPAAVEEKVGTDQYHTFIDQYTLTYFAPLAIEQQGLEIIMSPDTLAESPAERDKELQFTLVATPKPLYELSSYDPVSFSIPSVQVTEAEIDQQLLNIAENASTLERDEDRDVRTGDNILISIESENDKGETIAGLTAANRMYTTGQKFMPEDFDKNLIGMNVGETKTFTFSGPGIDKEGNQIEEAITSTVTIKELQKKVTPAITDAWVQKNFPNAKTVPEFRELIRGEGKRQKAAEQEQMKGYLAVTELSKRFTGSIADELYEHTQADLMQNFHAQLKQQGLTMEQFFEQQGIGEQQFSMSIMMQTREILVQGFALDALARHLKLEITDEDIEETFKAMAPGKEKEARREFEATGRMYLIKEAAQRMKANKWLVETAEIKVEDGK